MPAIWTAPQTWEFNQVMSAAQANQQLRDNLLFLKNKPRDVINYNALTNITQSATTSFAVIDDSKLTLNLVTSEANEHVILSLTGLLLLSTASQFLALDWLIDNTVYASNMTVTPVSNGCGVDYMAVTTGQLVYVRKRVIIPSAGAHTFKLRSKISTTPCTFTLATNNNTFEMEAKVD